MRLSPLILGLCLLPAGVTAQTGAAPTAALEQLTGGNSRQWSLIGNTAGATCAAGDRTYTFQQKAAQVVIQECVNGAWTPRTLPLTTWDANGKSGIAFGGVQYELKELHAGAPVCKGKANCIRLASLPDGKSDVTTTLYLTR